MTLRTRAGRNILWVRAHVGYQGDDCLKYPFGLDTHGYGQLGHEGKVLKAHRVMCELVHGPAPGPDYEAAHSCGRGHEACINPRHLSWKTRSENQQDRRKHGSRLGQPYGRYGKLKPDEVRQIRSLKGQKPQIEIGEMFGVSPATINKIHNGKLWVHIR